MINCALSKYMLYFYTVFCIIPMSFSTIYYRQDEQNKDSFRKLSLPYYLKVPTNVTAYEGANVILSCHVENLGDRMVFWIRNSDLQILTAGLATFSSDTRFKVNHENTIDEKDWSLLITNVRLEDSGLYECQINTEVKMKLNVNLSVKEHFEMMEMDSPFLPQYGAAIDGKSLNTLKRGQTITLICNINIDIQKENSEDFRRIEWVKDGEVVNLKTRNGGISIDTVWSGRGGTSKLTLSALQESDEGNYSCISNNFVSDVAEVKIVKENEGESEYSSEWTSKATRNNLISIVLYIILFDLLLL